MDDRNVTLAEARDFVIEQLMAASVSAENAADVADALVAAEADGLKGHGLSRLPSYAAQARSGKVDGHAIPVVTRSTPAVIMVDAQGGFAYPALKKGSAALIETTKEVGVAVLGVHHSNHCGVAGHHVERLADHGLVALMFANAPASIAPWGGSEPIYGTNPIAFAAPHRGRAPLVVDLSVSKVARGNIMAAAQRGDPIPAGWALDPDGNPTTDAQAGLQGTMLPMGDAKGTALALMVEILSATLVGANQSYEASSFFDGKGERPGTGQLIMALDPDAFASGFADRFASLAAAIEGQEGARLPGQRRVGLRQKAESQGVVITSALQKALDG